MAKIKYQSDGLFALTPCPYEIKAGYSTVKVNSHYCTHNCKYYRSTNYKEHTITCLADCASSLEEIINKIDIVIANDKCDDICFEDFIMEIRENIANIIDGTKEDSTRKEKN